MKAKSLFVLFPALLVAACGGGGGSGSSSPNPGSGAPASPQGIWTSTSTVNGFSEVTTVLVTSSGSVFSYTGPYTSTGCAIAAMGTWGVSGNNISGSGVISAEGGSCAFSDTSSEGTESWSGTFVQGQTLNATASGTTALGAAIPQQVLNLSYDGGSYLAGASNSVLANNAASYTWLPSGFGAPGVVTLASVTITSSGAMTAPILLTNCTVNGQFTIPNASQNVYEATGTVSCAAGTTSNLNGATVNVLAYTTNGLPPFLTLGIEFSPPGSAPIMAAAIFQ